MRTLGEHVKLYMKRKPRIRIEPGTLQLTIQTNTYCSQTYLYHFAVNFSVLTEQYALSRLNEQYSGM